MGEFKRCSKRPGCNCDPCHRRRIIITLLRSLRDAQETLQRGDGGGKIQFESRAMEMPAAFHAGSYGQLLVALVKLRRMGPRHFWHVSERYLRSERLTKDLLNVGGSYFEAEKVSQTWDDEGVIVRYAAGAPLSKNIEVLSGVAQPRVPVVSRPGTRTVLVRAVVERWHPAVERRPLETGLDSLSMLLPRALTLPSEIPVAA